jgi:XTP/dITP diphosphohydrolase
VEPSRVFILSTRNAHKAREIAAILGPGSRFLTLADFPESPVVVEDGDTFEANARKKAVELARWLIQDPARLASAGAARDIFVLADDSGLEVEALAGEPGVRSARFAASETSGNENCSDEANNRKLLRLLARIPQDQRRARFRCVIVLCPLRSGAIDNRQSTIDNSEAESASAVCFDGTCPGRILTGPRGAGGFGYDPLFAPDGYEQSYAELGENVKNRLSHRGRALVKLAEWLAARGG